MSAFMISEETMNRVVNGMSNRDGMQACETLDDLGRRLFAMNERAVAARYSDYKPWGDGADFRYRMKDYSPVNMLKAMDCLIYQCSEGNVPEEALYAELTGKRNAMMREIVRALPEYDAAPWDHYPEVSAAK